MLGLLMLYEGCIQAYENVERWEVYEVARKRAQQLGVPLVVVGCPKFGTYHHGYGDAVLDLKHKWWCTCPNPITMDLQHVDRKFPRRSCVIYSSHVLEHLTKTEGETAVRAMDIVAVEQYHVWPSKFSIAGQMAPAHKSWPYMENGRLKFEARV